MSGLYKTNSKSEYVNKNKNKKSFKGVFVICKIVYCVVGLAN